MFLNQLGKYCGRFKRADLCCNWGEQGNWQRDRACPRRKICTVYVTGRTTGDGDRTIDTTARQVNEAGGEGQPINVTMGDDADIERLFSQIGQESDCIDILVNNVYKIPNPPAWGGGYWDHPIQVWDDQVGIGLSHYVASWHAAALMFKSSSARMLNVSSPGGQSYHFLAPMVREKLALTSLPQTWLLSFSRKKFRPVCFTRGQFRLNLL